MGAAVAEPVIATKGYVDSGLSQKANITSIPTDTGDLTNDAGYIKADALDDFATTDEIPTATSDLDNDSNFVSDAAYVHTDNNYTNADKTTLGNVAAAVPAAASAANQLADKAFVAESVQTIAANPVNFNASGDPFPNKAALSGAASYYNGGAAYTPSRGDYAVVLADESAPSPFTGGQVRYQYSGSSWVYEYGINETPFTADQNAAINSGITTVGVAKLNAVEAGAQVNVKSDWSAASGDAQILNKPSFADVATSGSYDDLSNKPFVAKTAAEAQAYSAANPTKLVYVAAP